MRPAALAILAPLLLGCGDERQPAPETGASPSARPSRAVLVQDRYVVRQSARGFDATLSALLEALDRRELTVFAVIDHAAAASSVGASLPPTTVVIFGDPQAGTPLMAEVAILGTELPLRALVYERDGEVFVATTGIANLARTYPLSGQAEIPDRVERALNEIANEVAAP